MPEEHSPEFPRISLLSFPEQSGPPWMSIPETAAYLGLSRSGIYELIDSGDLVRVKSGRRAHVTKQSINRYVASVEAEGAE